MKKKLLDSKKVIAVSLSITMLLTMSGCSSKKNNDTTKQDTKQVETQSKENKTEKETEDTSNKEYKYKDYAKMTPDEILEKLTLEQKAAQMIMVDCKQTSEEAVKSECYGSVLSIPNGVYNVDSWQSSVDKLQTAALESEAGIPLK